MIMVQIMPLTVHKKLCGYQSPSHHFLVTQRRREKGEGSKLHTKDFKGIHNSVQFIFHFFPSPFIGSCCQRVEFTCRKIEVFNTVANKLKLTAHAFSQKRHWVAYGFCVQIGMPRPRLEQRNMLMRKLSISQYGRRVVD